MDDTMTLVLVAPITLGKGDAAVGYAELQLSKPTAEQLMAAEKVVGGMASLAELIRLNAAVPAGVVKQLRQRDLQRAADFFGRFAMASTGSETSSPS